VGDVSGVADRRGLGDVLDAAVSCRGRVMEQAGGSCRRGTAAALQPMGGCRRCGVREGLVAGRTPAGEVGDEHDGGLRRARRDRREPGWEQQTRDAGGPLSRWKLAEEARPAARARNWERLGVGVGFSIPRKNKTRFFYLVWAFFSILAGRELRRARAWFS
jgi:hypothetical protein